MDTTHFSVELSLGELLDCAAIAAASSTPTSVPGAGQRVADRRRQAPHLARSRVGSRRRDPRRKRPGPGSGDRSRTPRQPAALVAGARTSVTLAVGTELGRPAAELRGPGGVVAVTTHPGAVPDANLPLTDEETAATAVLDSAVLREALSSPGRSRSASTSARWRGPP